MDSDIALIKKVVVSVIKSADNVSKVAVEEIHQIKKVVVNTGKQGMSGIQGIQGPTGASAYDLWLIEGNQGTKYDFFQSLKGAKGEPGSFADLDPGNITLLFENKLV